MTYELLVSTRKGLLIGTSDDRAAWDFGDTPTSPAGRSTTPCATRPALGRRQPPAVGAASALLRRRRRLLAGEHSARIPRRDLHPLRIRHPQRRRDRESQH